MSVYYSIHFFRLLISCPVHSVPINALTSFTFLLDHLCLLLFLCQTPPSLFTQNNFFLLSISHQTVFLFPLLMQHVSKTIHARASPRCLAHTLVFWEQLLIHSVSVDFSVLMLPLLLDPSRILLYDTISQLN